MIQPRKHDDIYFFRFAALFVFNLTLTMVEKGSPLLMMIPVSLILAIWKLDVLPFPVVMKTTNIYNLVIGYIESGGSNTSDGKQLQLFFYFWDPIMCSPFYPISLLVICAVAG